MNFEGQIAGKTNQELIDICKNSDDYQKEFADLAYQELGKRGISVDKYRKENEVRAIQLNESLKLGKKGNDFYIILGFISALLGGVLGIVAGYVYSQSKEYGPSGERYYVYEKKTRENGRIMMILGIFIFLIAMIWKLS